MTRDRRPRRRLTIALALLCGALGAAIYAELDRPGAEHAAAATLAAPHPKAIPAVASHKMPPLGDYAEILERPVFTPTRRPAPASHAAATPLSSFTLVGIVASGDSRHALIEYGQPTRRERVSEGAAIGGWLVEAILPDRVVLSAGGAREDLKPKDRPPQIVVAPAAQPPKPKK